jgi:PBP1b-binding outer membrane lipoprotein LpoB
MKRTYIILIGLFFLSSCNEEFLTKDHPTATTDENFLEYGR